MAFFQTDNLYVSQHANGVASLVLDVADRKVNVLNRQVMADLDAALDRVTAEPSFHLLLIRSGKDSGFLAGADLHDFAAISNAEQAAALSEMGQRLFDKLANLRVPTVAVISGPCLGGGLELALACDYRVVGAGPKTQLGVPEIELGLLPAWGGTQRLPRVVGLERALHMILGAKRLGAHEALDWGLADAVEENPADAPPAFLAQPVKRPKTSLPLRTWRQRIIESNPLGRGLLFRGARRLLRRRVPDDFPAHGEALEAIRTGLNRGLAAGLAYEREAIGRLATTPACRNLVNLFFRREEARKLPQAPEAEAIRHVGVVGAGTMGAGIAQLAALKGADVVIREVNEPALAAGVLRIVALFNKARERGLVSAAEYQRKLDSVRGTTAWKGFADLDLVVEAVIEDLTAKRAVFRELEKEAPPSAILATNTSSLLVKDLQEGLRRPERVAGLHFFNPAHKMPLVEVVRAPATSAATIDALVRWAVTLGKTPVVVKDSPGFVVNRILMPYLNEAVLLVGEGLPVDRIDQVMRRFGMPLGPLELLDQIGLDVAAHVAGSMEPVFGSRLPPNPAYRLMKEKGWLGQKSGRGFYLYRGRRKRVNRAVVAELRASVAASALRGLEGLLPADQLRQARERMVGLMVNEAAACLGQQLADGPAAIDLAMVLGTGWAPHRGGPLQYGQDRGYGPIVAVLEDLARRCGPRFEPNADLRRLAAAEKTGPPTNAAPRS